MAEESRLNLGLVRTHFDSSAEVLRLACRDICLRLDEVFDFAPTGDIRSDFKRITEGYWSFWFDHPCAKLYVLESIRYPYLREGLIDASVRTIGHIFALYDYYSDAIRVPRSPDKFSYDVITGFLIGPVIARALWGRLGIARREFDHDEHMERFLYGFGLDDTAAGELGL